MACSGFGVRDVGTKRGWLGISKTTLAILSLGFLHAGLKMGSWTTILRTLGGTDGASGDDLSLIV